MKSSTSRPQGQLVADFLAGSWRDRQAALDISPADLEKVTSLLYNSGGTGLAWWRIHESDLRTSSCGELLHQGYRLQALQSAISEERLITAFGLLRDAGIEPILVKGWAAARFYAHRMLRAYGDVDLVVHPTEYSAARDALKQTEAGTWWVDLHQGSSELGDRSTDQLFKRSHLVAHKGLQIRVLSDEDHLALLAIHLFKHGAWRPSWLCDIAALIESVPPTFDWKICVGSNKRRAAWIAVAIALAHQLLEANLDKTPLALQERQLPEWLVDAVLKQWGNLFQADHLPVRPQRLMAYSLRSPRTLFKEICARWPDPIVATFNLRGGPNNIPRLPYQLGAFAAGAGRYLFWSAATSRRFLKR